MDMLDKQLLPHIVELGVSMFPPVISRDNLIVSPDPSLRIEQIIIFEIVRDSSPEQALETLRSRVNSYDTRDGMFPSLGSVSKALDIPLAQTENEHQISVKASATAHLNLLEQSGYNEYLKQVEHLLRDSPAEDLRSLISSTSTNSSYWGLWTPGLNNAEKTLGEILDTLPGLPETAIPSIVKKYEDPNSPTALPGAISLSRHDVPHALLGLGLLDQDEAFVIGFTMGNSTKYESKHGHEMLKVFAEDYPEPFKIWGDKLTAFNLGVEAGRRTTTRDLCESPIENLRSQTISGLRSQFGIDIDYVKQQYRILRESVPYSLESLRLP